MMIGETRLTLRQADEALKSERLEEAFRLLGQPGVRGHRSAGSLLNRLAGRLVKRGERRLASGESELAWGDLLRAEQTGSAGPDGERLRVALGRRGLDQVRVLLAAGEPGRAVDAVAGLLERGLQNGDVEQMGEAARSWLRARELADKGEFIPAAEAVERARKAANKPVIVLEEFRRSLKQRQDTVASLLVPLHAAAEQGRWGEVLSLSDKVLAAAPDHNDVRRLRSQAWRAVEPQAATVHLDSPETISPEGESASQRFVLWVDGVGGYLVCLGSRVTVGRAGHDAVVDVPLLADVSRVHATVVRDGESYLLEPSRQARVNEEPVSRSLLRAGDAIALGPTCRLSFRQPSVASASARLDVVSGHRLPMALDAVLLMADTLVLGSGSRVHVGLPGVSEPVVLFRHKDGLGVRHAGNLVVNGTPVSTRWVLGWSGTVAGDEFRFTIEPVGARLGRAV